MYMSRYFTLILSGIFLFFSCTATNISGSNDDNPSMDESKGHGDGDENHYADYENLSYIIDGRTFRMVLVDSKTLPPFYIMQTEIPSDSYLQIGGNYIGVLDENGDGAVIKAEFHRFLDKVREATGLAFRLPTMAEWRLAAKGGENGSGFTYSGSETIDDVAWYNGNSGNSAHGIATKEPNELGLYDMSGNYGDLCNDSDDIYYVDGRICGGCWNDAASKCTVTSYKNSDAEPSHIIPGTSSIRECNAYDGKYIAVRLVYSVPE